MLCRRLRESLRPVCLQQEEQFLYREGEERRAVAAIELLRLGGRATALPAQGLLLLVEGLRHWLERRYCPYTP